MLTQLFPTYPDHTLLLLLFPLFVLLSWYVPTHPPTLPQTSPYKTWVSTHPTHPPNPPTSPTQTTG